MPYVIFERAYNHRYPSRAVVAYPAGFAGSVPRAVAAAAVPDFARRAKPPTASKAVAAGGETQ